MSFLSGALNKSVFNQGTFVAAVGTDGHPGYAVVRITPNSNGRLGINGAGGGQDPSIKGVFNFEKGTFGFGVEANWAPLGDIGSTILPGSSTIKGIYEKINAGANIAGAAEMGAGLASQLIYQKSGHLDIKIPMMIVDWDGTGQPVMSSLLLSRYCLPSFILNAKTKFLEPGLQKLQEELTQLKDKIGNKKISPKEALQNNIDRQKKAELESKILNWGKEGVEFAKNIGGKLGVNGIFELGADSIGVVAEMGGQLIKKGVENVGGIDDAYTLRSSPTDVTVEIGQFFKNQKMVITNVSFEFSKEMTRSGPLYVEIDITLRSRRILTSIEDIGLKLPNAGGGRFLTSDDLGDGSNATGL